MSIELATCIYTWREKSLAYFVETNLMCSDTWRVRIYEPVDKKAEIFSRGNFTSEQKAFNAATSFLEENYSNRKCFKDLEVGTKFKKNAETIWMKVVANNQGNAVNVDGPAGVYMKGIISTFYDYEKVTPLEDEENA
jgi:hypothetical protein